ncbi:helix-turn-helix domain-containing protein [Aliihoeflea sp. PC F10.4]
MMAYLLNVAIVLKGNIRRIRKFLSLGGDLKSSMNINQEKSYNNTSFKRSETHQLAFDGHSTVHHTSENALWDFAYLSRQSEKPYQGHYSAVPHPMIGLVFDSSAAGSLQTANWSGSGEITPGAFAIIPKGREFEGTLESSSETLLIYIHSRIIDQVVEDFSIKGSTATDLLPVFNAKDPFIEYSARALLDASLHRGPLSSLYAEQLTRSLAVHLVHHHSDCDVPRQNSGYRTPFDRRKMNALREHIESNIGGPLSIEQMAREMAMSPVQFQRAFKRAFGQTPYQYVLKLRVEHAQRMLAQISAPISVIADECGFANQTHFSRVFKQMLGVAPAAYRKANSPR